MGNILVAQAIIPGDFTEPVAAVGARWVDEY